MPTLNWIGKEAVENHHNEVPFRLIKCREDLSVGEKNSGNLIMYGDNLEALKALLPYYGGLVSCIYIDPPYNTGNEGWVYNDAVNSPEMRDWLGKVVGREAEDLSRHDKWLCMMYPRLTLLKDMLSDKGSIWISIDDNETHRVRELMDEIFGAQNFITTVIWEKKYSPQNDAKYFSDNHDYIISYAKNKANWKRNLLPRTETQDKRYKNPDNDQRGPWKPADFSVKTYTPLYDYPITTPGGRIVNPPRGRCWQTNIDRYMELVNDNRIWFGKNGNNVPSIKKFLSEVQGGNVPKTIWFRSEVGDNQEAKTELKRISPEASRLFPTPKPTRLIQRILEIATNTDDLVLDSFAGSGATGHAVLKQNNKDGGNRHFILVEIEKEIAYKVTTHRLKSGIEGYSYKNQRGNDKIVTGLTGDFRFCELGVPLFEANGQIREEVNYVDLAHHVYFLETGTPLPIIDESFVKGTSYPLLGIHNGVAIYLLYNGILKDKSINGGNILTNEVITNLPKYEGLKVIYGTGCRLGQQKLRNLNIIFKQTPYEIRER